ncbi:fatty acid desaturase family protein [Streptomyces sp. MMBL 11-3]|uniref:fatty acid desaturase family protein n=1 Tax=Streptomyces sp. MMBL 11-3 TaxID=3382639 RepID=UPI0039B4DF64
MTTEAVDTPATVAAGSARATDPAPARRGSDYAALSREVRQSGLLRRRPVYYSVKIGTNLLLLAAGWTAFALIGESWWQLVTAAFLAVMFTQTAFIGHDAGHQQIAASKRVNNVLGRVHADLLVGLSYGWWIDKHTRHHSHPNHVDRDPDIADGAIAFTEDQARVRRGAYAWLGRHQAWLFFPMLLLEGLALHVAGVRATIDGTGRRTGRATMLAEAAMLTTHLAGYTAALFLVLTPLQAVAFLLVHQGLFGLYMGCSFAPNHKGMALFGKDDKVDFLRRQVLTSRNIRGHRLTDLALGGLNYQIEHHLFPSMPRPGLRHAQELVRAFCARHGIAYHETTLLDSYAQVLKHLHTVGGPLRLRPELEY